jgi:hypothetical protein
MPLQGPRKGMLGRFQKTDGSTAIINWRYIMAIEHVGPNDQVRVVLNGGYVIDCNTPIEGLWNEMSDNFPL